MTEQTRKLCTACDNFSATDVKCFDLPLEQVLVIHKV